MSAALRRFRLTDQVRLHWLPLTGLAVAFPLTVGAAEITARDAAAASDNTGGAIVALETVTVTAQKREQSLQDVPSAISAYTSDDIENAGVNTVQDVAALVPNLVMGDQLRPGITNVSIRGITTVQGGQSPFTVIVDGVQQPGQEFLKQQLVDVKQIEVLRGPQGTLYGAGAIAGAINIVTNQPADVVTGSAEVGYFDGDDRSGTLTFSAPIAQDKAYFRGSAWARKFDGLIDNDSAGKKADFVDEKSFRGQFLLTPTDALAFDLRASYTDGENGALWLAAVPNQDFDDFSDRYDPNTDIPGIDDRTLQTYSAKIDYKLDMLTLTSISAYNKSESVVIADGDFSPTPAAVQEWTNNSESFSQELRVASTGSGPLQYVAGLYLQSYNFDDLTWFGSVLSDGSYNYQFPVLNRYKSDSWAVFGQASYELTDRLTLTAGGRYDNDDKEAYDLVSGGNDEQKFSEFQPKVSAAYEFTPDVSGFATYSKGFRTGGFNPQTLSLQGVDALRTYDNETSDNYELGVKSSFLDNRLQVNASVFHTAFDNQQMFFSQATDVGIYRVIVNIPETEINGAELEVQAVPASWLRIVAGVGYNDTEIKKFQNGSFDGNRTPQVYGLTANLSPEATWTLADGSRLTARVDWQHRGDVYWDLGNELKTPAKDFLNARVTYSLGDDRRWSVAVVGRNLTDERTPGAVGPNALGPGMTLRSANAPRQVGAEVKFAF